MYNILYGQYKLFSTMFNYKFYLFVYLYYNRDIFLTEIEKEIESYI